MYRPRIELTLPGRGLLGKFRILARLREGFLNRLLYNSGSLYL